MKFFVSTGEASGDLHLSYLVKSVKSRYKDVDFVGVAGEKSKKEGVEILATVNGNITAVREKNMLAVSFHPELTNDTSVHEYFLDIIKNQKK